MPAPAAEAPPVRPEPPLARAALVYAPGLGRGPVNTADRVAELVAEWLSVKRERGYVAEPGKGTAPRGLKVGKTVYGPDGTALLDVFELDYRSRFATATPGDRLSSPMGALRAAWHAGLAFWRLRKAVRSRAKKRIAKVQLLYGFGLVAGLLTLAIVAVLVAFGALATDTLPEERTTQLAAAGTGVTLAGLWAWLRPRLIALSTHVRETTRYLEEHRHRESVTQTVEEAVDGLRDAGWEGRPIHLLGYSFGALVLLDALVPPDLPAEDRLRGAVTSLATVGCPADVVRLYYPSYFERGAARLPGLPWTNVYITADVFGSNFKDGDDDAGGEPAPIGGQSPTASHRYGDATLNVPKALGFRGFSEHGGYWGDAGEASCLGYAVPVWVPA